MQYSKRELMTSKQVVSIIINIFLVLNQTMTAAELTVDTGAARANQAELIKAPNGVPIVNIVTPPTLKGFHTINSPISMSIRKVLFLTIQKPLPTHSLQDTSRTIQI